MQDDFEMSWSSDELRDWLKDAHLDDEVNKYICKKINEFETR